jgi:hypothetical protein
MRLLLPIQLIDEELALGIILKRESEPHAMFEAHETLIQEQECSIRIIE